MSDKPTANGPASDGPPTSWQQLRERTLSVSAIRQVDRTAIEEFYMHSLVLMENAAAGCAQWLCERYAKRPKAVILCGRGNNGGDGLAITRHLRLAGWECSVFLLGPEEALASDALANWKILTARNPPGNTLVAPTDTANVEAHESVAQGIAESAVIIDAMLGSGARGTPRAPLDRWIELANAASAERIAIDIPSGLDAESGQPAPVSFRADHTLSFVAHKPGFHQPQARAYLGEITVLPIGIPNQLVEELLASSF